MWMERFGVRVAVLDARVLKRPIEQGQGVAAPSHAGLVCSLIVGIIICPATMQLPCSFWSLEAISPSPVPRLAFQEGSYGSQVAFMPQEMCLFVAVGPEFDGKS